MDDGSGWLSGGHWLLAQLFPLRSAIEERFAALAFGGGDCPGLRMSRAEVLDLTIWEMDDLIAIQSRKTRELNEAIKRAHEEAAAKAKAKRGR